MGETRTIGFSVDGEWLTDFVRQWFWLENKPYQTCEELLLSSLCNPEVSLEDRKKIACDIIEGRKKLIGVNSFELVDDNENVRPISEKLEEQRRKLKISEMALLMNSRMIAFVDPYSVKKSLRAAKEHHVMTFDQCMTWFWYHDNAIEKAYMRPQIPGEGMLLNEDDDTELGLWLYNYPNIVYDAFIASGETMPSSDYDDLFWKAVYDIITDESRPDYYNFSSKWFAKRNQNYQACRRMKQNKEKDENLLIKRFNKTAELSETDKRTIEFCREFLDTHDEPDKSEDDVATLLKYHTINLIYNVLTDKESRLFGDNRMYNIVPDEYENWEGLISPTGDFYSCDFGGHNAKAYHIMSAYPEKFPTFDYESRTLDMTTALDDILEQGWCATRYLPTVGSFIELPRTVSRECTKKQKDAIFDAKIKHDVSVDLSPIGY